MRRTAREKYRRYLTSRGWRRRRNRAVRRAHGKCQRCHKRTAKFDVHHLSYKHKGRERRWDLIALCHDCHQIKHGARF